MSTNEIRDAKEAWKGLNDEINPSNMINKKAPKDQRYNYVDVRIFV